MALDNGCQRVPGLRGVVDDDHVRAIKGGEQALDLGDATSCGNDDIDIDRVGVRVRGKGKGVRETPVNEHPRNEQLGFSAHHQAAMSSPSKTRHQLLGWLAQS